MPLENLNSEHYLDTEKTAVINSLNTLETALMPKIKNLSAEERRKYGSVNEQNKLLINKINDYRNSQPSLSSPDIDWSEFTNDFKSREFLQATINRLQSLIDGLNNKKIMHDFDNYQAALTDYDYSKYKAGTKAPGYETKVNEVSQFFTRTATKPKETSAEEQATNP